MSRTSSSKDTVRLMQQLLDNYEPKTTRKEVMTNAERAEENRFLEALMQTAVMKKLETILQQKGTVKVVSRWNTMCFLWFLVPFSSLMLCCYVFYHSIR